MVNVYTDDQIIVIAGLFAASLLLSIVTVSMFTLTGLITPASATLVETSNKTYGATNITWTSSFQDLDYTLDDPITMEVTWTVEEGAATYEGFSARRPYFTPKGRDYANGTLLSISQIDTTVTVTFKFTDLHWSEKHEWDPVNEEWISAGIGNAKFKLYLEIDKDGDGTPETVVGYGVNVHVEDPQQA